MFQRRVVLLRNERETENRTRIQMTCGLVVEIKIVGGNKKEKEKNRPKINSSLMCCVRLHQ